MSEQEKNSYLEQRVENLKKEIEYMQTALQEKEIQIGQLEREVNEPRRKEGSESKRVELPRQESHNWEGTLDNVIAEYVQFVEDYQTSSLFPSISEIHSAGFIKVVHHIQSESEKLKRNQNNIISKCMSIQQIVTLLLIEVENLLKFIHRNKLKASSEDQDRQHIAYLEQQSRSNLYSAVQQKTLDELRNEMNLLRNQNQRLQELVYSKDNQKNHAQPQVKTVYVSREDGSRAFYEKLVDTVSNYMCNAELKSMVQNVMEARNRYEDKDVEYQQRISHLEQLDAELKQIVKGGEQNETSAYQIRKVIEKERDQLGAVMEEKGKEFAA